MGIAVFPGCCLPGAKLWWSNEDNDDHLQKIPCMYSYTHCPQPCSRLPLTHASAGDSWTLTDKSGSVFCGVNCSFLLGPGAHKVLSVPSKSLFPSPVKFWQLYGGVMMTSSKRTYAIPKSAVPRAPVPVTVHCWPVPPQEMLNTVLSQSRWGP